MAKLILTGDPLKLKIIQRELKNRKGFDIELVEDSKIESMDDLKKKKKKRTTKEEKDL